MSSKIDDYIDQALEEVKCDEKNDIRQISLCTSGGYVCSVYDRVDEIDIMKEIMSVIYKHYTTETVKLRGRISDVSCGEKTQMSIVIEVG